MKSLNIKRIAAIATGVAMVGSVAATGLAAVNREGSVTDLASTIVKNLDKTQIVLGSYADITDGKAAAELSEVLSSLNFVEASNIGVDTTGATISSPKIVVETTSTSAQATAKHFDLVYNPLAATARPSVAATSGYESAQTGPSNTNIVTPSVLPGILTDGEVQTWGNVNNGAAVGPNQNLKFPYDERIIVGTANWVRYFESETPTGHGLYYVAAVPNANQNITYRLNFVKSGTGLPLETGAALTPYAKIPVIKVLGVDYALDAVEATNLFFTLYTGDEVTLHSGESYTTTDGYTVTLSGVGFTSAAAGQIVQADFSVSNPGNTATQTASLQQLQGWEFFNGAVTVYIDTTCTSCYVREGVATGQIVGRIGHGKLYFNAGNSFPLDDQWTVSAVGVRQNAGGSTVSYLTMVDMTYGRLGDPNPTKAGSFLGTELTGLKSGTIIDGPKNYNGEVLFDMKLAGFGGATKIDSTEIKLKGVGDNATGTDVIQVTWTDVGGMINEFTPNIQGEVGRNETTSLLGPPNNATIAFETPYRGGWHDWQTDHQYFGNGTYLNSTSPWGLVNNYSIKFAYIERDGTSGAALFTPVFYIGGPNTGRLVKASTPGNSTPNAAPFTWNTYSVARLTYTDISDTLQCDVAMYSMSAVQLFLNESFGATAVAGANCFLWPANIRAGPIQDMDLGRPMMNLTALTGGYVARTNADLSGGATPFGMTANASWPMFFLQEAAVTNTGAAVAAASYNGFTVLYDSSYTQNWSTGVDTYTGLIAVNRSWSTITGSSTVNNYRTGVHLNLSDITGSGYFYYVDTTANPVYEQQAYHITEAGTELSSGRTTGYNQLTIKAYEAVPGTVFSIAEKLRSENGTTTVEYGEGDTIPGTGVKITGITGDITGIGNGSVAGTYYTKGVGANFVTMDSTATATYKIVVGGPWVNTIAATIPGNDKTTTAAGQQYIIASGNNMLAAGYTGTDTIAAVNELKTILQQAAQSA